MTANPKPDNFIAIADSYRSIVIIDSHRMDGFRGMNLLEAQTRVIGILLETLVGFSRLLLNLWWQ
jgi:hypothetical protein